MTLEEAISRANNGDLDSIMALGKYYFGEDSDDNNRDINKAIEWYEKGASFGYPVCMMMAALALTISGHSLRKIAGSSAAEDTIKELNRGLYWAGKAKEVGFEGADKQIITLKGELGIAYWLWGHTSELNKPSQQQTIERYYTSIRLLKEVYRFTDDKEVVFYLALAIDSLADIVTVSEDDNRLAFMLFHKCADDYFGELEQSNIASFYLGQMYMYGRGCNQDYNLAHDYYLKAHNAGFDCSEILSCFKKKMFGGYTLKK